MSSRIAVTVAAALFVVACSDTPTEPGTASFAAGGNKKLFVETFEPVGPVPCNGLVRNGISYTFTIAGVASGDCGAFVNAGPAVSNSTDFPVLEGNSHGTLTLVFDHPTTVLNFGVAQFSVLSPQTATVELYRPGHGALRQEIVLANTLDPVFVGGRFEYSGPAVLTATITFSTVSRFAIDNIEFFRPPGQLK